MENRSPRAYTLNLEWRKIHADPSTGVSFIQKEDKTPLGTDEGVGRGWKESVVRPLC